MATSDYCSVPAPPPHLTRIILRHTQRTVEAGKKKIENGVRRLPKKRKAEKVATFELLFWSKVAPSPKTSESRSVDLCCKSYF